MRTPAQASVNVIVREDLTRMREEAKYRGMEATFDRRADRAIMSILIAVHAQDQLDRLRKTIEDESANILLRSGCGYGFANGGAFAASLKLQQDACTRKHLNIWCPGTSMRAARCKLMGAFLCARIVVRRF